MSTLLITWPCNNNIRNQINSDTRSCWGQAGEVAGKYSQTNMNCNLDGGQGRRGNTLRELEQTSVFSGGNVSSC